MCSNTDHPNGERERLHAEELQAEKLRADMKRDVIRVLSKEINNTSTLIHRFRNRVSFMAWVGPFIILGSILVATSKALPLRVTPVWHLFATLVAIAAFYTLLALLGGRIERQGWKHCNRLRDAIRNLYSTRDYVITQNDYWDPVEDSVVAGYVAACLGMFFCAIAVACMTLYLEPIGRNSGETQGSISEPAGVPPQKVPVVEPKQNPTSGATAVSGGTVALVVASLSALGALASVIVSVWSFRTNHRTTIQPVVVFARRSEDSADWQVQNVGNGPALNVRVLDQDDKGAWIKCVGFYPLAAGTTVHLWDGLVANGLAAVYTDVYGRWYTTICTSNQNTVSRGNKFAGVAETGQEFPLRKKGPTPHA